MKDVAKPIAHLIRETPQGTRIDLRSLYLYPDGHANLVFADGTNWPMADPYEVVEILVEELLIPMHRAAGKVLRRRVAELESDAAALSEQVEAATK